MCTVVNRTLPSMHGGSFEITLTVPLIIMRFITSQYSPKTSLNKIIKTIKQTYLEIITH